MTTGPLDFELLLKLRLVIARFGEMDLAKWWNTKGQLGRLGATALRRGFPRTHHFAQARSVFAIASHRCAEVFEHPGSVTLWRLPEDLEEAFDSRWEDWLDHSEEWSVFFKKLETIPGTDLPGILLSLDLLGAGDLKALDKIKRSDEGRAVPLSRTFSGTNADITLLALGFARGEPSALAVPYAKKAEA